MEMGLIRRMARFDVLGLLLVALRRHGGVSFSPNAARTKNLPLNVLFGKLRFTTIDDGFYGLRHFLSRTKIEGNGAPISRAFL
jgi:hypothetical protein